MSQREILQRITRLERLLAAVATKLGVDDPGFDTGPACAVVAPATVDPWLSAREAAELVLDHGRYPRSTRVLRNMQKRIQKACRLHRDDQVDPEYRAFFGLACPAPLPNGRVQLKRSELMKWAERMRIRGLAE